MAPTPQEISVSLEALRADADQWAAAAGTMHAAAGLAETQRLDPAVFSFAGLTAATTYELLRARMARLLDQGASAFESIAAALRASADSYEADEAAGAHRIRNVY